MKEPNLSLPTSRESRYLHRASSLPILGLDYMIAALPLIIWSCYLNGPRTLVLVFISMVFSLIWEAIGEGLLRRRVTVWDTSALVDGLLFALLLPITTPLWLIALGTLIQTLLFKVLPGGQGKCPIHPAIGSVAILNLFFAPILHRYAAPFEILPATDLLPSAGGAQSFLDALAAGAVPTEDMLTQMLIGNTSGSMGQLSLLLLLGSALYLWQRGYLSFFPTLLSLGTVFALTFFFPTSTITSDAMASGAALIATFSGSLFFLIVLPAAHPAHSPYTVGGRVVYFLGIGALTVLIRHFTPLSDGAVYAALVMQATVPLLNRLFRRRHYAQN